MGYWVFVLMDDRLRLLSIVAMNGGAFMGMRWILGMYCMRNIEQL